MIDHGRKMNGKASKGEAGKTMSVSPHRLFLKVAIAKGEGGPNTPRSENLNSHCAFGGGLYLPAVHHDRATEEVAESVHSPAQLEEQVRVFGDPMVWPAGELNVGHCSPSCFFFPLARG